jgi:uracil-DNA glycosylase family 4
LGSTLRNWRNDVHACRLCRNEPVEGTTAAGSSEPARTPELRLLHHKPVPSGQDERCGWATPMLDKSRDPDYELELLERSCGSGIVVVMEAPNHDDTYKISKGYLTCDTKTDETGKFLFKLLKSIDLSPEDVLLTNTVQCLPARRGERYPVSTRQRQNCRDHLRRLFEIVRPRVVVAFGNESLRALHRFQPVQIDGRVQRDEALKVSQLVGVPIEPWAGTSTSRPCMPRPSRASRRPSIPYRVQLSTRMLMHLSGSWAIPWIRSM